MARYGKKETLEFLNASGIVLEKMEHEPVFTVDEMDAAGISARGGVCKNLFLRDAKGKKHYLVVAPEEKRVDLSALPAQLGSTKLSFASAERLEKYLGVAQGSVSPLGLLNDEGHEVTFVVDKDLCTAARMGVHPNENTATVWLSYKDLKGIVEKLGNKIICVKL